MRRFAIGTAAVVTAIALSGCVGFNGQPRGKQIAENKVRIAFGVCKASATPNCSDQGYMEEGFSRVLIGLRVRKGALAPETLTSVLEGIPLDRAPDYTRELNQTAPRNEQYNRWFGWVTRERRANADWPEYDRFRITLRLLKRHGKVFRYRPVVGYQEVPETGPPEPITCGGDALEPDGTQTARCIDAPEPEEVRTNLKIKLD